MTTRAIRMRKLMAGPDGTAQAGQIVTGVSAETARQLVEGGYAEYVQPPAIETAEAQPPERAVGPRGKKGKK